MAWPALLIQGLTQHWHTYITRLSVSYHLLSASVGKCVRSPIAMFDWFGENMGAYLPGNSSKSGMYGYIFCQIIYRRFLLQYGGSPRSLAITILAGDRDMLDEDTCQSSLAHYQS